MQQDKPRCTWAKGPLMQAYHDTEWGVPTRDDGRLYEMLLLEAFQAGLSWHVILSKRENFRRAFDGFDPHKIAAYDEAKIAELLEDAGIVLGQAVARALGDKRGIARFGSLSLPMDEALVLAAVDISGRGQLHWAVDVPCVMLGTFDASLAKEFFIAFAANAGLTLHVRSLAGENAHHIVEASFKAAARALRQAVELDPRIGDALPSTKGAL